MWPYRSRVRLNLNVVQWGHSRCALAPSALSSHTLAGGLGVSTICEAVIDPSDVRVCPRVVRVVDVWNIF